MDEKINGDTSGLGGKRFNVGKPQWHRMPWDWLEELVKLTTDEFLEYELLPPEWIAAATKVMMRGKKKYGEGNWEKGMNWSTVLDSLTRHAVALWKGEDFDEETQFYHAYLLMCNAGFLISYWMHKKGVDDRHTCRDKYKEQVYGEEKNI